LGDQLDPESAALDGLDVQHDAVWMAEVAEESTHVWSHKARIALFLSAMHCYRDALRRRGIRVLHRQLGDPGNLGSLARKLLIPVQQVILVLTLFQPHSAGIRQVADALRPRLVRVGFRQAACDPRNLIPLGHRPLSLEIYGGFRG